jgi:serine/threonine protein kinase/tetratricopeptide (TPR) repeat protein
MGVVYEAQDTRLPRSVAIKFLKPALSKNVEAVRRFKREARLASSLNHPNICTVLDVDEGDGQSFIAMELLQGLALKERLASGPITLDEILDIGAQVVDALAAAHDQGIMHRDITPGNIFITEGGLVKVLDFGLAKQFASLDDDGQITDDLTQPGTVAGTVHYMAPEQFEEDALLDHRCDLFSFGAVLYQMATGTRPFQAKSKNEVMALIREQPHVPLRQLRPDASVELEGIIDRLLAKRPCDRYQTALALRADFAQMRGRAHPPQQSGGDVESRRVSAAVLPFEIVGPSGPDIEHFRDGLTEDISGRLSAIRDVRLAPRTSTRRVMKESIREIGKRLDVQMVVEGSVQQADNRVKVIASLVDAASERALLPSIRIERQFDDILGIQDDIAREIVAGVAVSFTRAPGSQYTKDLEAYHAFKRGQQHWKSPFKGGWRSALEDFQYAVERDERFSAAHVALGAAYNFLGFYGHLKPNLAFSVARRSLERALEIDDTLAAAHTELALVKFGGDWDWDGSEYELRRALRIEPASPVAHVYYAWLLVLLGREDAGLAEAQAAHALAPSSRFIGCGRAQALYLAHRFDEAIEVCNECLRFDPDYAFALHLRGWCYQAKSMHKEAVADLEQAATVGHRAPFYLGLLGHCYALGGMSSKVAGLLAELDRQGREIYVPPQCYVYIYAGLGQREKALEYQEKAYEDGASPLNYLTPFIRNFYALDPRHKKRLEQMRLVL